MSDDLAPEVGHVVDRVAEVAVGSKDPARSYVGLEDLRSGDKRVVGVRPSSVSTSVNSVFRSGDILFGKLRPALRKCVQVDFAGYSSTDLLVLRPRPGQDHRFAGHLLASDFVFRRAEATAIGTGMPRTSWSAVRAIQVRVPRIDEQRRIAEVLDTVDEAIHSTERLIATLATVAVSVERSMMARLDGTTTIPLVRLASVDRGRFTARPRNDPRYYGGESPFIQTGDVAAASRGPIAHASQSLNADGTAVSRAFPIGTIAVTIAANIGDTAILAREMYFPDSVVGVVPNPSVNPRWLEMCIAAAKPGLEARAPQSAQRNINLQVLRPLPIPVLAREEQDRIAEAWEAGAERIASERSSLHALQQLRAGLADDLLTGRVRTVPG